jgi:hypothetical protein
MILRSEILSCCSDLLLHWEHECFPSVHYLISVAGVEDVGLLASFVALWVEEDSGKEQQAVHASG